MKAFKIKLNTDEISNVLDSIESILTKNKISSEVIIRMRLSIEDNLMQLQEHYGEKHLVDIYIKDLWFRPIVEIKYSGEDFNPYKAEYSDDILECGNFTYLLERMGLAPQHVYKKNRNAVIYRLPWKQPSDLQKVGFAVVSAFIVGLTMHLFATESLCDIVTDNILSPIESIFLGLLGTVSLPLIFFSSAAGIVGIGDREKLGSISGKLVRQFVGHTAIYLLIFTALAMAFFGIELTDQTTGSGEGIEMTKLTGQFFPANFIQPFLNGNTIQIVLISIVLGVALLSLGSRTRMVSSIILELNDLFLLLMSWLGSFIPLFLFALLTKVILDNSFAMFLSAWKLLLMTMGLPIPLLLLVAFVTSRKYGLTLIEMLARIKQTFIMALTTLSTLATLPVMMKEGVEVLGINRSFSNVATPLAAILVRYHYAVVLMAYTLFFAHAYSIGLSVGTMCILLPAALIMAIATPAVAGGALASVTLLFTIAGIPMEAIGIVALLEVIIDFNSGFNISTTQLEVALLAKRLGMTNDTNASNMPRNKE